MTTEEKAKVDQLASDLIVAGATLFSTMLLNGIGRNDLANKICTSVAGYLRKNGALKQQVGQTNDPCACTNYPFPHFHKNG